LTNFEPRQFKDRDDFRGIWKLAVPVGASSSPYQGLYVVGDKATLDKWAPFSENKYHSFIETIEYTFADEEDERGDLQEDEEWRDVMFTMEEGDFVIL